MHLINGSRTHTPSLFAWIKDVIHHPQNEEVKEKVMLVQSREYGEKTSLQYTGCLSEESFGNSIGAFKAPAGISFLGNGGYECPPQAHSAVSSDEIISNLRSETSGCCSSISVKATTSAMIDEEDILLFNVAL